MTWRHVFAVAAVPLLVVATVAMLAPAVLLFGAAIVAAILRPEPPRRGRRMGPLR